MLSLTPSPTTTSSLLLLVMVCIRIATCKACIFTDTCCPGIWDCQSSQAVVEFVRRGIAAKQELSKISENMMDNCLASNSETGGVGCDNMTMIVIALLRGKSKDEWYKEIGDRVAKGDGPCAPPEYGNLTSAPEYKNLY